MQAGGTQFHLFLLSRHLRVPEKVKALRVCQGTWRHLLVWNAMSAMLGQLDFYLRCCFNGFENCQVGSEICHHGIDARSAAHEWLVRLFWKFNWYTVYRTTFVTSRLCKPFCLNLQDAIPESLLWGQAQGEAGPHETFRSRRHGHMWLLRSPYEQRWHYSYSRWSDWFVLKNQLLIQPSFFYWELQVSLLLE